MFENEPKLHRVPIDIAHPFHLPLIGNICCQPEQPVHLGNAWVNEIVVAAIGAIVVVVIARILA